MIYFFKNNTTSKHDQHMQRRCMCSVRAIFVFFLREKRDFGVFPSIRDQTNDMLTFFLWLIKTSWFKVHMAH